MTANANLFELISAAMPADRETPLLVMPDGKGYTYGDVDRLSARLAHRLRGQGVGKGDPVAVQVEKSPEAVCLYLACLRAGAVYLPLNTGYTKAELDYFFGDAKPRVIVCDPAAAAGLESLPGARDASMLALGATGDGTLTDDLAGLPERFATEACAADDLAALLYTSGTTGRSKGAMLTHRNLGSNAEALRLTWGFTEADVLLHALPIYHTHGLFVAVNTTLLAGARMLFFRHFEPGAVIAALPRATAMMGVPTYYARLLARPDFTRDVCAGMRLFISGSAPLLEETFHAFEARTGQRILERYGMTETGMSTSNPLEGERRGGTVGLPLPGVEARVADEGGEILPRGETGVLEVRGPNVFKGYWQMPEKTREEFRDDGFFITGDVARIDPDGYITIVGRAKDLIISGGLNVYPKEVESVIDRLPGVVESAVVGLPHPDFGEGVAAVIVREPSATLAEADVIAAAKTELAGFKVPKKVVFVDGLPRNSMGKVQKNLLRDTYCKTFGS
jgi:malonyl-CoA/methylmalonyl-CoA synthetase